MKTRLYFPIILLLVVLLLPSCTLPTTEETSQAPDAVATAAPAILTVAEQTGCFYGPGANYGQAALLELGQSFEIVGIDDDIAWIDDDIAWFQVDPTAVVDPNPPHRPLDQAAGSGMAVRCWAPGDKVEVSGDLTRVPIIQVPVLRVLETVGCYAAPGTTNDQVVSLDAGLWFRILAIDDDIAWIDDDIAWFQVDPTAVVDPNPPHRPLDQAAGSGMSVRCWAPGDKVETEGDLTQTQTIRPPVLRVAESVGCYAAPDMAYEQIAALDAGQWFRILAIDDDIAWIDDDIAWFQVDPTAIVDPEPPHRPLDQTAGSGMAVRCWTPGTSVETEGDLFVLPVGFHHPGLRVLTDANCRSGPTRDYPVRSFVAAGSEYGIRARNSRGDAWMIFDPAINGTCWIYGGLVEVFGDTDLVMVIDPEPPHLTMPETPEATDAQSSPPVVDCSQYNTNPQACNANQACYWDSNVPPNGACKNK